MDLLKFDQAINQKLGLNKQQEFKTFKNRVLTIFKGIDSNVTSEGRRQFCLFYGIPDNSSLAWHGTNIQSRLSEEDNKIEFVKLVALILNLPFMIRSLSPFDIEDWRSKYLREITEAIKMSALPFALEFTNDNEIIIVPLDENMLDNEVVKPVLSFLNDKSNKHFIKALKNFSEKEYIAVAESLRRALEEFLRFKLKNEKGLDANIGEVGKRLKENKSEVHIRNIIQQVFNYLDIYFNDNSKHRDGNLTEPDARFLIYQIATLMVYINQYQL